MERYRILLDKSIDSIKKGGIRLFIKKAVNYVKMRITIDKSADDPSKTYMDVLFINGCYLSHPSRYRVSHQREQLFANNMVTNEVFYNKIKIDMVAYYRVFIFFRCPITDEIEEFVKKAKSQNKVVLFDIDDLVIDRKYTDTIKYLKTMTPLEKQSYDDGVERMQKLLRMCDGAITSTERLAKELKNYVPDVFINRNTSSDRMLELSNKAVDFREKALNYDIEQVKNSSENNKLIKYRNKRQNKIRIGYFSGSITHNDDFIMILPVIIKIMDEFKNVELNIIGELDVPKELDHLKDRIKASPFIPWEKLPELIASVDINLVPIEQSIFNEAKSENKWVEASLVKVPTISSNVGAMKKMIKNNETGILCTNNEEWYIALKNLIEDENKRTSLAENAHIYVIKHCLTLYTGLPLKNYLMSKMKPNIVFVMPSTQISGGVLVVLKHCAMLKKHGYDVLLLNENVEHEPIEKDGEEILVISKLNSYIYGHFDKCVATLWSTLDFLKLYPNIKNRYYIVQNFETNFYEAGNKLRFLANSTYTCSYPPIKYITISKWCKKWLEDDYGQKAIGYAPNGIDTKLFYPIKRDFSKKIIILVEGNSDDYYKNVDESFRIVNKLDKEKYEIWFMSYQGKPKDWYRVDKFLHKIPSDKVADIYRKCHILIKSSILESFSYPPLEMMATGGAVVVAPNEGNIEYLKDNENCLMYEQGNINQALEKIEKICSADKLRENLYKNGIQTANEREWNILEKNILTLYDAIE